MHYLKYKNLIAKFKRVIHKISKKCLQNLLYILSNLKKINDI